MDYQYWVETINIPRGRHVAVRVKHRISRLIEFKINPISRTLICTVLMEEPVLERHGEVDDERTELTPELLQAAAEVGIDVSLAARESR